MAFLKRRFSIPAAALAAAAVLVPTSLAQTRGTVLPTLYVNYATNCTFTMTDDNGKTVTSIAPGTYEVLVSSQFPFAGPDLTGVHDFTDCKGEVQFQLTGPGVNLFTDIDNGGSASSLLSGTFQASSTYTAVDLNQPAVARVVFTTAASGSPVDPQAPTYTAPASSGKSSSDTSNVVSLGPKVVPFVGTLTGTVSTSGKLSLSFDGKPVTGLKAGRYTVRVTDRSKKQGFELQRVTKTPTAITKPAFTGTYAEIVTIATGQWLYFSGKTQTHYFFVTA